MKNNTLKKILPHFIAVMVFLLVAVIFCKPALEPGVVMQQSDYIQADAMKHQSVLYKEAHGVYPLWITSMFGGMPAYNIVFDGPSSPFFIVDKLLQLWLPKPLNFFFLSCICFYFLCMSLRVRPYVAILGSLAFAYSSYNPILVAAGHDTKLLALAYAPALLSGIILLFNKKYISGFLFTALFTTLHLFQNHQQISYYTFIIILIMTLFYIIKWIKEKDTKHLIKVIPLALGAALIGIMINSILLFPVLDYSKYSKRGGQLVMENNGAAKTAGVVNDKTTGLSREYAFQWSYGKMETFSLLFPGITGYGTYISKRDGEYNIFPKLTDNSNVSNYLQQSLNLPEDKAAEVSTGLYDSIYWGDKPMTSGSNYLGASICFLFILGMFLLDNKHKWWIFTASIFGIILAMGKNLSGINYFLFDYMPMYNKFRTPEMALVIPQILFPLMAVLTTQKISENEDGLILKKLRSAGIVMAGIFVFAGLVYFSLDYSKENKERTAAVTAAFATPDSTLNIKMQQINQQYEQLVDNRVFENFLQQTKGNVKVSMALVTALRNDRKSFFGKDILHSLLFVMLTIGLIGLFIYKKVNALLFVIGMSLLTVLDLLPFDTHYVNEKSFDLAEKYSTNEFPETEADKQILLDKDPNFRVLNYASRDPFNEAKTAYYHKSVGGYHPAKLGIIDDLIHYQLGNSQPNPAVLNMLNVKYFIEAKDEKGTPFVVPNPSVLGNAWFVKGIKYVNGPAQEMRALDNFNPRDTAIIDESYKNLVTGFVAADSNSFIKQSAFDNMAIQYQSSSNAINLAVFSEIFYKDWNAYIDGKNTPVVKSNYVLRALLIPAGKHTIDFKFEPTIFKTSYTISLIANWFLFALFIAYGIYILIQFKQRNS